MKKSIYIDVLLKRKEHSWVIASSQIQRNLKTLLLSIPYEFYIEMMNEHKEILFLKHRMIRLSDAIYLSNTQQDTLKDKNTKKSDLYTIASSIVAFIVKGNDLKQRIKRDRLLIDMGFSKQIENEILSTTESMDKRVRLSYLSSYFFKSWDNQQYCNESSAQSILQN